MKKIFYLSSFLLLFLGISVSAQNEPSSIRVEVTDENGRKIKKEYHSKEAMKNDPELQRLGIKMDVEGPGITIRSAGENRHVSILQENGSNRIEIRQNNDASGADSIHRPASPMPPHPPTPPLPPAVGMEELAEEHQQMMEMRDSILTFRLQEMEERMEEARMRREEMRLRMEERRKKVERQFMDRREESGGGNRRVVIEELAENEAGRLGIKKMELKLDDLQINPDPHNGLFSIKFRANSKKPVKIILSDENNNLLINEKTDLSSKSFEKVFEPGSFKRGTYFLQIIQDNKVLARKVRVE